MAKTAVRKKATPKKTGEKKAAKKKTAPRSAHRWSAKVTDESDALDLKKRVFTYKNPEKIAACLKRSAERSKRRKTTPFQSAMSMLNFYINRAGKNLPEKQQKDLEDAKDELRKLFGREEKDDE